jgi:hypothetical protein
MHAEGRPIVPTYLTSLLQDAGILECHDNGSHDAAVAKYKPYLPAEYKSRSYEIGDSNVYRILAQQFRSTIFDLCASHGLITGMVLPCYYGDKGKFTILRGGVKCLSDGLYTTEFGNLNTAHNIAAAKATAELGYIPGGTLICSTSPGEGEAHADLPPIFRGPYLTLPPSWAVEYTAGETVMVWMLGREQWAGGCVGRGREARRARR